TVVSVAIATDLADWERRLGRTIADEELEVDNVALRGLGRGVTATEYVGTVNWLHAWTRRVAAWWADDGFDLLLSPVLNGPPPPIGWLRDPEHGLARLGSLMQYTSQWNMTGQPAVSLPLHHTTGGLPVGVQLVAGAGREDLLVRVAAQVESAAPWADRHPAV
ncbi:MAG: amidase family protein, partial [Acidimicrobiales bacterium]